MLCTFSDDDHACDVQVEPRGTTQGAGAAGWRVSVAAARYVGTDGAAATRDAGRGTLTWCSGRAMQPIEHECAGRATDFATAAQCASHLRELAAQGVRVPARVIERLSAAAADEAVRKSFVRRSSGMSVNIVGFMRNNPYPRGWDVFLNDDGSTMTSQEALSFLSRQIAKGHKLIPARQGCGTPCNHADKGCPGFDPQERGCPGYVIVEVDAGHCANG